MDNLDKEKKNRERTKKGTIAAALLSGALAAGSPAHAVDFDEGSDYTDRPNTLTDSYEYPISDDAVRALDVLVAQFPTGSAVSLEKIQAAVTAYEKSHPRLVGKTTVTEKGVFSDVSYEPLLDLRMAMQRYGDMNPILHGLLQKELDDRLTSLPPSEVTVEGVTETFTELHEQVAKLFVDKLLEQLSKISTAESLDAVPRPDLLFLTDSYLNAFAKARDVQRNMRLDSTALAFALDELETRTVRDERAKVYIKKYMRNIELLDSESPPGTIRPNPILPQDI